MNGSAISGAERQDAEIRYLRRATGRPYACHPPLSDVSCPAECIYGHVKDQHPSRLSQDLTHLAVLQVTCSSQQLRLKHTTAAPESKSYRKGKCLAIVLCWHG